MEFDWTTFLLEIINFLILVWILKRFLYRPVLNVIARRRENIEKSLEEARRMRADATTIKQQNEERLLQWEREREAAQAKLLEELANERTSRIAALEGEISMERQRRQVLLERQQHEFQRTAEEKGIAQGATFAAKLLQRIATPELEGQLYRLLLEDLGDLRLEDRQRISQAATASSPQVTVQSAFVLDENRRRELAKALADLTGRALPVEYRENPELIAGFQVNVGPWVLHANLRDELKFFGGVMRHAG